MEIQYILELIGTFVFAISGALAVDEKDQDWFGAGFTGFVTAIGGGTLRDMLLGSYPLVWIGDVRFLYAIFAGIVFAAIFYKLLLRLRRTLSLFDTLGIALFTVVGTEKALSLGVDPVIAAIMGMFTAVMGGVIRDTLTNETPVIFQKEVYASACLAGAFMYIGLAHFDVQRTVAFLSSVILIIIIRLVAVKYNLSLPKFKRYN
ncbi:trimeric intracellular cation channel family protein [Pontibacter sp. KCTC 32443]|uniref:trimeric intracellular cation channel family protein n=1 Tax=Pontibacter TaxID=323449 RepID=UPI00164DF51B|nr:MULTISPECIES: trimeric intracellular cation channel family protein [Pontibacter]MBC5775556.1 trimeric intracellular cation channel family protein [Pontibacter sp. KCTC 32443]